MIPTGLIPRRLRNSFTPQGTQSITQFDALDRVKQVTHQQVGGTTEVTDYTYDGLGRVSDVEHSATGITHYDFTNYGEVSQVTEPNGLSHVTFYDAIGRANRLQTSLNGNLVRGRRFEFNENGAIQQEKDLNGNLLANYAYDNLGRLMSASRGGHTYNYSYDLANNRTAETIDNATRSFAYNPANRLTSVSGPAGYLTADHDANGNMTRLGSDILSWNIRGQLASITSGGQTSTFGYDVYNRRTSKSVTGSGARSYKWSGWSSNGGSGTGVFAKTNGVDNHNSLAGNAVITDHLGSIVTLLNSTGGVAQQNSFDPFGQVISNTNTNSFEGQNYGFTGLEHDESGLVYARNRYYSPGLGRFISEDPIGFGGGSNFFAYCGNDPINFTDPLGLMAMGLYGGGGFWIGGTADNPTLAFGGPTSTPAASYRCSRAEEDESSPAFDGGFVSMRSQHEGMDGKSARSRWAYHAIEKVRDQYCGAAFSFATAGLGMIAVETAEGIAAAKGVAAAGSDSGYVYRGLRHGEDVAAGLFARAPGANTSVMSHVAGKKMSCWISTTKDATIAFSKYNRDGCGVVQIDLSKLSNEFIDVSSGEGLRGRMKFWSIRDVEVLVRDFIPADAIEVLK